MLQTPAHKQLIEPQLRCYNYDPAFSGETIVVNSFIFQYADVLDRAADKKFRIAAQMATLLGLK